MLSLSKGYQNPPQLKGIRLHENELFSLNYFEVLFNICTMSNVIITLKFKEAIAPLSDLKGEISSFLVEQGTLVGSLLWLNEETVMFASDEIDHFEEKFWKKVFHNDFRSQGLKFSIDIKSELVMS